MFSEILFFVLGCLVGWFTNHWYSVVMRRPSLRQTGGGGGSSFSASSYPYVSASISNELRQLGLQLPETKILRKPIKTTFGNHIIEREPARQCQARLLEESGNLICHLWWLDGQKISHTV